MSRNIFSQMSGETSEVENTPFRYRQENDNFFNRVTVTVDKAGMLEQRFNEQNPKDMTGIRVVGPIDATDLAFLSKLSSGNELESLHSINLHDALIGCLPPRCFEGLVYLTHLYLPTGLEEIGVFALANCNALTEIILPQGLKRIGQQAFINLHLHSICIPASVEHIGEGALAGIKELTEVCVDKANGRFRLIDGLLIDEREKLLLQCFNFKTGEVRIVEGIERIGTLAFGRAQEVTSVYIPQSVRRIGSDAFASTYSLQCINVEETNVNYSSIEGVLFDKAQTELICYPSSREVTEYVVPATVRVLAAGAFQEAGGQNSHVGKTEKNRQMLKRVELPEGLEEIGTDAFLFSGIEHVNLPSSVRKIGRNSFYYTNIEEAIVPEGVQRLEDGVFYACYSLRKVSLPSTLKYVGAGVFDLSDGLKNIEIHAQVPPECHPEAFGKIGTHPKLHVVGGDLAAYEADEQWVMLSDRKMSTRLRLNAPLRLDAASKEKLKHIALYQETSKRVAVLDKDFFRRKN